MKDCMLMKIFLSSWMIVWASMATSNVFANKEKISDAIDLTPTEESSLRLFCSDDENAYEWTLPNGENISLGTDNATNSYGVELDKGQLTIPSVSSHNIGHYACVLGNSTQRHFYILYVLPKPRDVSSILLSLTITGVFTTICIAIWLAERYCFRPNLQCRMPDRMPIARKKFDSSSDNSSYSTVLHM